MALARDCRYCAIGDGHLPLGGEVVRWGPRWFVVHCQGALPLGSLSVVPRRHVTTVGGLDQSEATALGPALTAVASTVDELLRPAQVFVSQWSFAGGTRQHLHVNVVPGHGGELTPAAQQAAQLAAGVPPDDDDARAFLHAVATRLNARWAATEP